MKLMACDKCRRYRILENQVTPSYVCAETNTFKKDLKTNMKSDTKGS